MRDIVTVKGNISPEELGFCQFHEHLLIRKGVSGQINPALCFEDVELSKKEVKAYKAAGGSTIVDAQPVGCSRMAEGLLEISQNSGVNIITSTGFHKMIFYPKDSWIFSMTKGQIRDIYVNELTKGVYDNVDFGWNDRQSDIRAGVIKTALDTENLTDQYRKLFSAAAEAALETDRTIMVHIENGSDPLGLLDYLLAEGLDPTRLVFCHMDRAIPDLTVHRKILENGVFLEFDTVGRFKYHSDAREIEIFKNHINNGFEDQLLFSLDTTKARLKAYDETCEIGLDYIFRVFIDEMKAAGICEDTIACISMSNPLRALIG